MAEKNSDLNNNYFPAEVESLRIRKKEGSVKSTGIDLDVSDFIAFSKAA